LICSLCSKVPLPTLPAKSPVVAVTSTLILPVIVPTPFVICVCVVPTNKPAIVEPPKSMNQEQRCSPDPFIDDSTDSALMRIDPWRRRSKSHVVRIEPDLPDERSRTVPFISKPVTAAENEMSQAVVVPSVVHFGCGCSIGGLPLMSTSKLCGSMGAAAAVAAAASATRITNALDIRFRLTVFRTPERHNLFPG